MELTKIIKDFFNPKVHKAIKKFETIGEMIYADRNFPEQILLANHGYISKYPINFTTFIIDPEEAYYEFGCLNPKSIKGINDITMNIMHLTDKGRLFQYLKYPIRALYSKITGESF